MNTVFRQAIGKYVKKTMVVTNDTDCQALQISCQYRTALCLSCDLLKLSHYKLFGDQPGADGSEETKELKKTVKDLKNFAEKSDNLLETFIKAEESWFWNAMLKLLK